MKWSWKVAPRLVLPLVMAATGSLVWAHVRLVNPGNGYELHWGMPANISIVINATGSANLTDNSHFPALQNAIRTWNTASGSAARLVENTSGAQRARTDWQSDDIHLMYFDESNTSGYFPSGTGIVAITPVWFTNSGAISDADVLFNGQDFEFTTSGTHGAFDIQDVATHELGHLLGLDHSGWAGATMYPYVDPSVVLHRSLSQDDVCGVRDAYPSTAFGSISGVIRRANDSYVAGAHVVARGSDGRPYGSDLTTYLGAFRIHGLPPGSYALYATPLDTPVSASNLSPGHTVHTDFQSTTVGTFNVPGVDDVPIGSRTVLADTTLSLGRTTDTFPARCIAGATRTLTLRGSGLSSSCTLTASDPSVDIDVLTWAATQVSFEVTAPADAQLGHVDLTVTNATGDHHTLVGGLEVTPPDPVVATVTPSQGSIHGGTDIIITGLNFRAGAHVVIGMRSYFEGASGGCTVESSNVIRLRTAPAPAGMCNVVVADASGVEGRASGGFTFGAQPAIDSVFPLAGSAAGGTPLVLRGTEFIEGCTVTINGIVQSSVQVTPTRIAITTGPGVPGGPYTVEVQNPGGETASALFSYTLAPDPLITTLDPASGTADGGEVVVVHGANFTPTTGVWFGSDGDSGAGGAPAQQVQFVDANTLSVVTPSFSGGRRNVVVLDSATHQAAVAASAYTFVSSGGRGGACSMQPIAPSEPPFRGASGWIVLVCAFAWIVFRAERSKRVSA